LKRMRSYAKWQRSDASLEFKETIWYCCEACREKYYRKHHKKDLKNANLDN
jgi:hypothetical protein